MTHTICDACETVAHCMKSGCIPLQPYQATPNKLLDNDGENRAVRELLDHYPRLRDWYEIGPVQRAELEAFVDAALQRGCTAVTADGELVSTGDQVYVLSSTGKIEKTTVQELKAVTHYYLFGYIPVSSSFSTKQAAQLYKDTAHEYH